MSDELTAFASRYLQGASGNLAGAAPACPEDVLLAWLLWLPTDQDPATAAASELRRTELIAPTNPHLIRLAQLLRQVVVAQRRPTEVMIESPEEMLQ